MKNPKKLLFGTAGIPISAEKRDTLTGIETVRKLGLGCMELEFVRGVNISKEHFSFIKKKAEQEDIVLTCHAPYYINLNAVEPYKKKASMQRIEKSAEALYGCGGWSVCFHPGFYLKQNPDKVYETIKNSIKEIKERLDQKGIDLWLRPETTGKPSQFGSYIELLKISQEIDKVMPVFDFSHIHARSNGSYNTIEEFRKIFEDIELYLGKEGLNNMHIHFSGINYNEKGEKNHLFLEESDMNYKDLAKTWKEFRIKGCAISESPNIEYDALLVKKEYSQYKIL